MTSIPTSATSIAPSTTETIVVGDRTRTVTLVGAPAAPAGRALVVVLHGSGQSGAVHRRVTVGHYDRLAAEGRAVIAYPDGIGTQRNDLQRSSRTKARRLGVDDVAFVRAVVARLAHSHGIDPGRVAVVGFSNGGQMAMRLLLEAPELVAAALIIGATLPVAGDLLPTIADGAPQPRPLTLVHGDADPISRIGGGSRAWWVRMLFNAGGTMRSATSTAEWFAQRNGIRGTPTRTSLGPRRGTTGAERLDYRAPGAPTVSLVTVVGGGHTVPGPSSAPGFLGAGTDAVAAVDLVTELLDAVGGAVSR